MTTNLEAGRLPTAALALASPYQGYVYSYPHKSAYRALDPPLALDELWAGEEADARFLYVHIPFCEARCDYCNLFAEAGAADRRIQDYLDQLACQIEVVSRLVPPRQLGGFGIGGGTPTRLAASQLERVRGLIERHFGLDLRTTHSTVETSPATAKPERLRALKRWGVERISIGIQSFVEEEVRAVGRIQTYESVRRALDRLRELEFERINLDLMYGLPNQNMASWTYSLEQALAYRPEELYLYPLYIRPLTGLHDDGTNWEDKRLALYRFGRERLLAVGYRQRSMRHFVLERESPDTRREAPVYRCQEDAMIGLGCGARSYTQNVHYSHDYAVGRNEIVEILNDYMRLTPRAFAQASHGIVLNAEERRRRYLIKTLFLVDGVDSHAYRRLFGSSITDDFTKLSELEAIGWIEISEAQVALTETGLAYSDAIGPWLFSARVRERMQAAALR